MVAIRRSITFALVTLGLLLFGCGGNEVEWYGTWEGKMDFADPSIAEPGVREQINLVQLKIKIDGTFVLVHAMAPTTGNHVVNGNSVTLSVKKFMDRPTENRVIKVEIQEDGTALLFDSFYGDPVVLTKQEQPTGD